MRCWYLNPKDGKFDDLKLFKKHFKNKENAKVAYRKENGNQILLKMSLAVILKILRMKDDEY